MRLIILLGTLAIAVPFIIAQAAMPSGNAVSLRFLERPTNIGNPKYTVPPEVAKVESLGADSLLAWVQSRPQSARGYAFYVMPLDVLYLICLGLFLGYASTLLVDVTHWPATLSPIPMWVVWLLPAAYIVCDLAEDLLIIVMLGWPTTIHAGAFAPLSLFRTLKIASVGISFGQVFLLCLVSFVWPAAKV
ncbi:MULTISPECIES: hypothetical protein [unclassified Bradyrhizobium]|uniref:hypothetical protein n=1 Tax=unclassified Bradyrhizobium TaxID=2631580 RepID=UPI0028EB75B7|nr:MULTISPECIES: hypothetical protein [unclassified Bradyrhizobium]